MLQADTPVSWQDYVAIISRRRWFFLVPCASILAVTLIVGMLMPRHYRAETVILVQEPNIMNPLIQGLAVSTPVGERLRTLKEEILSWSSLSRLVNELQLARTVKSSVAFEALIKKLQAEIEVSMKSRDLIRIAYEHPSPQLSQRLVNTVSTIFLDRHMAAQTAEAGTAIDFLNREMELYKTKLEESEGALRRFNERYASRMPVAVQLNKEIVTLQVQLADLLINSTEKHPSVVQTRLRIEELTARRNAELKRFIVSAMAEEKDKTTYQNLLKAIDMPEPDVTGVDPAQARAAKEAYNSMVARLDQEQAAQTGPIIVGQAPAPVAGGAAATSPGLTTPVSIALGPWQEQELARLTRDYQVNLTTYQHLQQRLEKARITQRFGESDEGVKFKILEPARLPLKPVRPNMVHVLLFGLAFGLFAGVGVAFLAEYLDQSFQTADEVQTTLDAPVLGSISTIVTPDDLARRRSQVRRWMSGQPFGTAVRQASMPIVRGVERAMAKRGL